MEMCQNHSVQHCMSQIDPEWNDSSKAEKRTYIPDQQVAHEQQSMGDS